MPKIVDQDERRVAIAKAAWRIVRRDGVDGVSVRAVSAEVGLATASLRAAFPTQVALLAFCFELVLERAAARITSLSAHGSERERAERTLLEVLPLDQERHAEMQVWLAFAAASLTEPQLAPIYARGHEALWQLCRSVVRPLVPRSRLELEANRLHALVDGVAMHLVYQDDPTATETARVVLAAHLDSLGQRPKQVASRQARSLIM